MVGLSLLALLVSTQEPDTSVRISFRTPAAPLGRVLSALTEATKIQFVAAPTTSPDVVVIDVKDVTLKDLMDRIALADSAEWQFANGSFRLGAAQGKRVTEARREVQERANQIRSQIKERLAPPKKQAPKPQSPDRPLYDGDETISSDDATIYRLLAQLNATDLGSMVAGDRLVYATNPTPTQRAIGQGVGPLVQAWIQKHNTDVAQMPGMPPGGDESSTGETPDVLEDIFVDRMKPVTAPVAKVMLIVEKGGGLMSATTAEVRVYDASGNVIKRAQTYLEMGEMMGMRRTDTPNDKPDASATNTPIELSEDSKSLDKALQGMESGQIGLELQPDLKQKLLRPDLFDPLSFHCSDALFSYAKWKKRPMVAVVPDSMEEVQQIGSGTSTSLEDFNRAITESTYLKQLADESWVLLMPTRPEEARSQRLNRASLTRLINAGASSGVRLDDIATYALSNPPPMETPAALVYLLAFAPETVSMSMGMSLGMGNGWPMLRLYASLDQGSKLAVRSGRSIPFAGLDSKQLAMVSRMVYGADARLTVEHPGDAKKEDDPFSFVYAMLQGSKDYREEPTEILPTGLLGSGQISVETIDDNFIRPAKGMPGPGLGASLGVDELAAFSMMKADPAIASSPELFRLPTEGKLGQRTVLKFTFHLTPAVTIRQTLYDDLLPANAPTVRLDALPEAFQRRVKQKMESMKKGPLGMPGAPLGEKPRANP